jgi:hypothetical protein
MAMFHVEQLFTDAELAEQSVEHVLDSRATRDTVKGNPGLPQGLRGDQKVLRARGLLKPSGAFGEQDPVAGIDCDFVFAREQMSRPDEQDTREFVQPRTSQCRHRNISFRSRAKNVGLRVDA